ncbi:Nn.00g113060.m01.CDS01 [Neocucurbitaria sp. VM-36]
MLSIQQPTTPQKCTPHLLPARINHNGPINDTQRYWKPQTDDKGNFLHFPYACFVRMTHLLIELNAHASNDIGTQHVHFRGRHLHGTALPLPKKYTGVVLDITEKKLPSAPSREVSSTRRDEGLDDGVDDDAGEEEGEDVLIAEEMGRFEEIVVWGHGGTVDEEGEGVVRAVREWVGFAESMHCDGEGEGEKKG